MNKQEAIKAGALSALLSGGPTYGVYERRAGEFCYLNFADSAFFPREPEQLLTLECHLAAENLLVRRILTAEASYDGRIPQVGDWILYRRSDEGFQQGRMAFDQVTAILPEPPGNPIQHAFGVLDGVGIIAPGMSINAQHARVRTTPGAIVGEILAVLSADDVRTA